MRRRGGRGFTLVEILVASAVVVVVAAIAFIALRASRRPLERGTERAERVAELRLSIERMGRELRTARQVLFPAPRTDGVASAPERVLAFRDFEGRFILYSFDGASGELRRSVLPLDDLPVEDREPLASDLDEALFTVSRRRLVSVLCIRDGVPALSSVRLLNG